MIKKFSQFVALLLLVLCLFTSAEAQPKDLKTKLPVDPAVIIGKLDNGLTYYIRHNGKPENRAELQIVVKAASIQEEDDQAGLAHFIEHMCFNGTEHFPKNDLIKFLENTGMRFGADVNANTGFDRTYYLLTIPLDSAGMLDKGLLVLEDWLSNVSFDPEELEKERGVILEEWRIYRGADMRALRKHLPYLVYGSKFVDRLPIGDTAIILHAPRERFTTFYKNWYRPNISAVIAVGDFDVKVIEQKIKDHFAKATNPPNAPKLEKYPVPDHNETFVSIFVDKEVTMPNLTIYFKHDEKEEGTIGAYKDNIITSLATSMLNNRYAEKRNEADAPFLVAISQEADFIGPKRVFALVSIMKAGDIDRAYKTTLEEAFRIYQHGYTAGELERVKKEMMKNIEQLYNERNKTESVNYATEYMRNFMTGEGIPGIEYEYNLYKQFLPEITIEMVNQRMKELIIDKNIVITMTLPETEAVAIPEESKLKQVFTEVKNSKLEPYIDKFANVPLMEKKPTPGKIVKETKNKELGLTIWELSNGAKVYLKPTNFKNDEILFQAYSPGGYSLASDRDFISASNASGILGEYGAGKFDRITLSKMLAGKDVSLSLGINETSEFLRGSAAPADLETMLQVLYLGVAEQVMDDAAFNRYKVQLKEIIENSKRRPESALSDTLQVTLAQYHKRRMPLQPLDVEKISHKKAYQFAMDRFADFSDFTFFFVGAIDLKKVKPLVETYLASLPSLKKNEKWVDNGIRYPKGVIKKEVNKGIADKSTVRLVITGDFEYNKENRFYLQSMMEYLSIRLREQIREEKGGTYGVGAWGRFSHYPHSDYNINITFSTNPTRVNELIGDAMNIIEDLKKNPPTPEYLQKVKEIQRREYETNMKQNSYWMENLYSYVSNNEDLTKFLNHPKYIEKLTAEDIRNAANKYLNTDNLVQVVLYPEEKPKE